MADEATCAVTQPLRSNVQFEGDATTRCSAKRYTESGAECAGGEGCSTYFIANSTESTIEVYWDDGDCVTVKSNAADDGVWKIPNSDVRKMTKKNQKIFKN